jgi:pimeloyl-ACP methyl ester carboxylesterase
MAVIAQRQRRLEITGQGCEAAEMTDPGFVVELRRAHRWRPAVVAEPEEGLREIRRLDRIVEGVPERQDRRFGTIGSGLRKRRHQSIGLAAMSRGEGMADWSEGYWWSNDGLRLHYREYAGDTSRPPILCIPGLTRNARDFEGVAARLKGDWRLICVDLRGRGDSAYAKDPMSYVPLTYLQDLEALIRELALERFVLFGTSLGGLMTMLLAMSGGERIAGALLNDIGPVLERAGSTISAPMSASRRTGRPGCTPPASCARRSATAIPTGKLDQWLVFAKRIAKLNASGRIVFDYDMRIAEPFSVPGGESGFDLWSAFAGLKGVPP